MAIRLITDSASDILPQEAAELGIVHLPLTVSFGDEEYIDSVTLTHKQFYEKLAASSVLPTTSQISPAAFSEAFRKIIDGGDVAVAIVLSSSLSGTYQSACIAAGDFPGKALVVDSQNVCIGQRLLVLRALELIREGLSPDELVARLNWEKKFIRVMAVLDTLEYLKKGGRISSATAFAGELLSIKPVVAVKDGAVALVGKARGSKNSGNLLRKLILEGNGVNYKRPYCVAYSGLSDEMLQKYISDNADLWQTATRTLPIATVGCAIGTHIGPGAIAVAFFEKVMKEV